MLLAGASCRAAQGVFFLRSGKVREFASSQGNSLLYLKVSEKSGNFIFQFTKFVEKRKEVKNEEQNFDGLQKNAKRGNVGVCLFNYSPNERSVKIV